MTDRETAIPSPEVDFAVLADAATAVDGKVYVHGGGWDRIVAASFPLVHGTMALAIRVRVPWGRTNEKFLAEIDLVDEDNVSVFGKLGAERPSQVVEVGRPPGIERGSDLGFVFTWTFQGLAFERPGAYAFVVSIEGRESKRIRFWVSQQ